MINRIKRTGVFFLAGLLSSLAVAESNLQLSLDRQNGIYRKGDPVELTIDYQVDGQPGKGPMQIIVIGPDGSQTVRDFPEIQKKFTAVIDSWLRFTVVIPTDAGKNGNPQKKKKPAGNSASIGAVAEPEKFRPGLEEPADFQAFWDQALAELAKVPVKAVRKEVDPPQKMSGKFKCWDVQVDCAGNAPVSGYLTMPVDVAPKSLPAVVSFHGAGVSSSWKTVTPGAIHFNVNAHGIANGQPKEFYKNLKEKDLAHYARRNADNREKFYFRNMFLRVKRALDYVKTLPEYDGKTLIVRGSSQGGAQALVAAGLDPDVVLMAAMVPAMCDHGGILAGRKSGWPGLIQMKNGKPVNPDIVKTAAYYDAAFFAKRIRAESYITVGLIDKTCCPSSVYAAFNNIPGKKYITVYPAKGHEYAPSQEFNQRSEELIRQATSRK